MNYLKPALLIALATASAGVGAQQQYYPQAQTQNTGEIIIQQILDHVIGRRYTTDNRYRSAQEQEMFRRADTNRDGYLTQAEVDAYRARMGYGRYGNQPYQDNRYQDNRYGYGYRYDPGISVNQVDTNRDGYISKAEAANFVRDLQRYGLDGYYYRSTGRR